MREEVDNVPEGAASDFLSFLIDFKEDGCSEPYLRGIVAAFPSHCPLFYVPYHFILAHDEQLALNIQDNYSRISEDLKKSVVRYLSMNEVEFPDVVLKIIGLPEPKSYNDKPNGKLEDATTGNMVQGLVDSISDDKRTGYLYSEVSVYSEPQHVSVLFNDADLAQLQIQMNNNGFESELTGDGRLQCGSVFLYTRDYPPTEQYDGHSVMVVEGPFSVEYEAVFLFLTGWLRM